MSTEKKIDQPVIVLVGPTAIGKTALSLELAAKYNCEIVSMDSMQIYRHMDIGTAKIMPADQQNIPHHLLDIVNPDQPYDAARYYNDAIRCIEEIHARGALPLITGGTGLYLQSLTSGFFEGPPADEKIRTKLQDRLESEGPQALYTELQRVDNESAIRIHINDSYRILRALEIYQLTGKPWSKHISEQTKESSLTNLIQIGLTCQREKLYQRINLRTEIMLEAGLEQEVRKLLEMGYGPDLNSMGSIGYKHMINYINGSWNFEEMKNLLARDTRRYAKRQYTWFNKNNDLNWFDIADSKQVVDKIEQWLGEQNRG